MTRRVVGSESAEEQESTVQIPPIKYWVLAPSSEVYTPYQGFGAGIASPAFAALVDTLAVLPASIEELFCTAEALPALRKPHSPKRSSIVGVDILAKMHESGMFADCVNVFVGLQKQVVDSKSLLGGTSAVYVSLKSDAATVGIEEYKGHPAQLIDEALISAASERMGVPVASALPGQTKRDPFEGSSDVPSRISGVTNANERLAESLLFAYSGTQPIHLTSVGVYEDAVLASVEQARRMVDSELVDLILYAPAIAKPLYAFGSSFWNNIFRKITSKVIREIIKDGLFRNKGYSGFALKLEELKEEDNPYNDPVAGPILTIRQTELRLTASAIAALATSGSSPAIRVPNAVNMHSAELRDIEQFASRSDPRGERLLQQAFKRLADGLLGDIDERLTRYVRDHADGVTIVSDAPLEWLRIDGVPLLIRNETSRIGMTPGNLMMSECLEAGVVLVPDVALHDVLIIRSFNDEDPIRTVLAKAVEAFGLKQVRVQVRDVTSRDELIVALNEFQGAIVVFDCHGGHDGESGHGWLRIGREKVDTWELAHAGRIPPIVILSACSTFALAGSHASVGNGLLRSGAVTVIGTFLPVDALRSAVFVARVLHRIDSFLPAIREQGADFVTWKTLIGSFFRMSYTTDLLSYFIKAKQWLQQDDFEDIALQANYDINHLRRDWYTRLIGRLAKQSKRDPEEITRAIELEHPLFETMLYCQLGRPELIGIFVGDVDELRDR